MSADNRSPKDIERDIEAARARLASTVDELAYRVKPANVAKRQAETAKTALYDNTHTPNGDLRMDVVVPAALAAAGLLVIAIVRRVRH